MTSLATLLYYPRSIGIFSSGIIAGTNLVVYYGSVPAFKASKNPLPSFVTSYNKEKYIAIPNIIISTVASAYCYYQTKNQMYLYSALLSFFSAPFTLLFIAPIINQLFALEKEKSYYVDHLNQLINHWKILHTPRAIAGLAAFAINVFL